MSKYFLLTFENVFFFFIDSGLLFIYYSRSVVLEFLLASNTWKIFIQKLYFIVTVFFGFLTDIVLTVSEHLLPL